MTKTSKPQVYRDIIDHLVDDCHNGQGQIYSGRVRKGIWNENALSESLRETSESLRDQQEINLLLARMPEADREIFALLLAEAFEGGVFETLKALEQFQITPFESGYEGSPYEDFIGRLHGWKWPER